MRKVVDANFLRDPLLRDYLRSSAENIVVFTDYSCMESYKGDSIHNLRRSLDIISRHPTQAIVLRGTREAVALGPVADSREALIDTDQTAGFPLFCFAVSRAALGDSALVSQIRAHGKLANEHFHRVQGDAPQFARSVLQVLGSLEPRAVKQLRKGESLKPETVDGMIRQILLLAAYLFRDHPDAGKTPSAREVRSTFIFRVALATYLLTLRWISDGGVQTATPAKIGNDFVDMVQVAYATFFDGILSRDRKLLQIHKEATFFLREIFR